MADTCTETLIAPETFGGGGYFNGEPPLSQGVGYIVLCLALVSSSLSSPAF
jgi:hypothetical protein